MHTKTEKQKKLLMTYTKTPTDVTYTLMNSASKDMPSHHTALHCCDMSNRKR